ncbi:hypothetical protein [Pseudoprevotella muciniphila]|nr:hypothetical protein [Pseudoprevotella muciniphila]
MDKALVYLQGLTGFNDLVDSFSKMNDKQRADFKYPSYVSETMNKFKSGDRRYNKNSDYYRNLNTIVTAINILKACANLNMAIISMSDKYKTKNISYHYLYAQSFSSYANEDVLRIKKAAIEAKNRINCFSKKYTIQGFEESCINTVKYGVYAICNKFMVETRTITQRTTEVGTNIIMSIIGFVVFCLAFWVLAKCASGH